MWDSLWTLAMTVRAAAETSAPPAETATPPGLGGKQMLVFFAVFVAFMYFFMIRPNQKRDRERRERRVSVAVLGQGGQRNSDPQGEERDQAAAVHDSLRTA